MNVNLFVLILIVASLLTAILSVYAWTKRKFFETISLAGLLFSISLWSLASAFELIVESLATKEVFTLICYIGITSIPVWFFLFALSYSGNSKIISSTKRRFLWVVPIFSLTALATNRLHWLFYSQSTIEYYLGKAYHSVEHGPLWWVNFTYSYLLISLAIIVLLRMYVNGTNVQRRPLQIILIASVIPIASNILYIAGVKPLSFVDLTPLAFTITGILFFWGIYSANIFSIKPVAFSKLFNSLPEGIVVTDKGKRIVDMNSSAERILHINAESCIGKQISRVFPDISFSIVKEANQFDRVELFDRIAEVNFSVIDTESDETSGYVLIVRDITEKVRTQTELKSASERIELAILAAGFDTWENDLVANVRKGGDRIFSELGYDKSEIPSTLNDLFGVVHPDDIPVLKDRMQAHFDGKTSVYNCDFRVRDKRGIYHWVTNYGRLVERDSNGNPYRFIGITLNIDERKRAEERIQKKNEELQRANSEKDKFFSIIAHDLKGPFQGFIGLTELMAENLSDMTIEQAQEITASLQSTAKNLYELLDNLLNWALIKRGHKRFSPEKVYLRSLVHIVSEILSSQLKVKGIGFVNSIADDMIALADKESLKTVLRNLVSNAVKFTPRNGEITVGCSEVDKGMLVVSVADTGIGMSEEIRNSLFTITKKVSRPGTDNEPSTGLGLILCKELVEKHGGKIWVKSTEGKGSIFYFSIPSSS
jgi:PAS domain S-box-containing protein